MNKFRIIQQTIGNQEPTYYIEKRNWLGFYSSIVEIFYDMNTLVTFTSEKEASFYIDKRYPTRSLIVKTIER